MELSQADRIPALEYEIVSTMSISRIADRRFDSTSQHQARTRTTTMRFMMLMYPGPKAETGAPPDAAPAAAMMRYNEELTRAGVLLALDGLQPSASGARIRGAGANRTIIDGPFSDAQNIVGGYWLIQVRSREEAIAWASRAPLGDDDMVELRQVCEMSDFPDDAAPAEKR